MEIIIYFLAAIVRKLELGFILKANQNTVFIFFMDSSAHVLECTLERSSPIKNKSVFRFALSIHGHKIDKKSIFF
jgi:hypothetical protein